MTSGSYPQRADQPDPAAASSELWRPSPDWSEAAIERAGWAVRAGPRPWQVLLGGDVDLAIATLAPGAPRIGLWAIVDAGSPYAVTIGRDKALLVTPVAGVCVSGWRPQGWSATVADSSYQILEFSGAGALDLLRAAVSTHLDRPSRSAAVQVAGFPVLLYRRSSTQAVVHVEHALATGLWTWLL
ncbi:MAG: hypothetical protein FGM55_06780, partial [Rhodoferax sp.]|nr:hypothetical protein [Rhodoferax sp.]